MDNQARARKKLLANREHRMLLAERYAGRLEFPELCREMASALDDRLIQILGEDQP